MNFHKDDTIGREAAYAWHVTMQPEEKSKYRDFSEYLESCRENAEKMKTGADQLLIAEWNNSPELRAEFNNKLENYMAFKKAEANGQVKIFKKRVS